MNLKNSRLLKALHRQPVDRTPIWLMRQAGRYLPEYNQTRAKAGSFLKLCKTPELACEVTLQPIHRFNLDAAIIFSDILIIPDAMGMQLAFKEGEGPYFERPFQTLADIQRLREFAVTEKLNYLFQAVQLVKAELTGKIPLIGFTGSPWTIATYMIENGASKQFNKIKKLMMTEPAILQQLLELLTQMVADCLLEQINAGVEVVMVFDTWGGILTTKDYERFSLSYMKKIVTTIKQKRPDVPIILFTKNGGQWLEKIAQTQCDGVGIDWMTDLADAKRRVGSQVALQGNLDPCILLSTPDIIKREAQKILDVYHGETGFVFNLGHGISKDTPIENVKALVEMIGAQ